MQRGTISAETHWRSRRVDPEACTARCEEALELVARTHIGDRQGLERDVKHRCAAEPEASGC